MDSPTPRRYPDALALTWLQSPLFDALIGSALLSFSCRPGPENWRRTTPRGTCPVSFPMFLRGECAWVESLFAHLIVNPWYCLH